MIVKTEPRWLGRLNSHSSDRHGYYYLFDREQDVVGRLNCGSWSPARAIRSGEQVRDLTGYRLENKQYSQVHLILEEIPDNEPDEGCLWMGRVSNSYYFFKDEESLVRVMNGLEYPYSNKNFVSSMCIRGFQNAINYRLDDMQYCKIKMRIEDIPWEG